MKELFRKKIDTESEQLAQQYVNRSSIRQDLIDSLAAVELAIRKSEEWKDKLNEDGKNDEIIIMNAIWQSAVLHYTRCFTSSDHRGHINKKDILPILNDDFRELHDLVMELRNEYLAHHSGETEHQELEVYGVIYERGPGQITHRIESGGLRTMGFERQAYEHFQNLFNQIYQWYNDTQAQPITNKLGEKYTPIHVAEFNPGVTYNTEP